MKGVQNAQMQGPQGTKSSDTLDVRDPHWMRLIEGDSMSRDGLVRI